MRQPIDLFLSKYFSGSKLGPTDRAWIADNFYELHRWKGLLDYVTPPPATWSTRLRTYFISDRWRAHTMNERLPGHIRGSCPEVLFKRLEFTYGPKKALQICHVLNEPAPTFLRINPQRTRRDQMLKFLLSKGVMVEKSINSPLCLQLQSKQRMLDLPEYNTGMFEIQDESSQLIAQKLPIKPGQIILDFCAGSGGKSVILGPMLHNQGKIFLHDIKEKALARSKQRMKNAGVMNYQTLTHKDPILKTLRGKVDWVIVDPPCTAIGAARRSPDLKWNFTDQRLFEMVGLQREIFEDALKYVKPGGRIVYSTASILDEENVQQIKYFCFKHNLALVEPPTHSLPVSKGMDGFFLAIMTPKRSAEDLISNKKNNSNKQIDDSHSFERKTVTDDEDLTENHTISERQQSLEDELINSLPENVEYPPRHK
eukprot:GDKJ01058881.1.p1 GENE.GDKJ01058881.1~~GDKJ01058881.1.p1  ORF type:complete len:458 (-),score=61.45 GDKJ01058881.1:85-1362(-)